MECWQCNQLCIHMGALRIGSPQRNHSAQQLIIVQHDYNDWSHSRSPQIIHNYVPVCTCFQNPRQQFIPFYRHNWPPCSCFQNPPVGQVLQSSPHVGPNNEAIYVFNVTNNHIIIITMQNTQRYQFLRQVLYPHHQMSGFALTPFFGAYVPAQPAQIRSSSYAYFQQLRNSLMQSSSQINANLQSGSYMRAQQPRTSLMWSQSQINSYLQGHQPRNSPMQAERQINSPQGEQPTNSQRLLSQATLPDVVQSMNSLVQACQQSINPSRQDEGSMQSSYDRTRQWLRQVVQSLPAPIMYPPSDPPVSRPRHHIDISSLARPQIHNYMRPRISMNNSVQPSPTNCCAANTSEESSLTNGSNTMNNSERVSPTNLSIENSVEQMSTTNSNILNSAEQMSPTDRSTRSPTERLSPINKSATSSTERLSPIDRSTTNSTERQSPINGSTTSSTERLSQANESTTSSTERLSQTNERTTSSTERLSQANESTTSSTERLGQANESTTSSNERLGQTNERTTSSTERLSPTNESTTSSAGNPTAPIPSVQVHPQPRQGLSLEEAFLSIDSSWDPNSEVEDWPGFEWNN